MNELERLGIDDKFGVVYDNEAMQKRMINTARNWGYDDGYDAGKEVGLKEGKISIAKNLLKNGVSIDLVSESTGLNEEEINKLIEELNNL